MIIKNSNLYRLKILAESLQATNPKEASALEKIIYSMVNKKDGAKLRIESILEHAIQDYYQIRLDGSGFNTEHWTSTLKGHLGNVLKINEAPNVRDGFYLDNDELNLLVKDSNPEVGGPFNQALDHLGFDGSEENWYRNYEEDLTIVDLFNIIDLDCPLYSRKYKRY